MKPRLKLVAGVPIPLPASNAEKLAAAIAYLRSRGKYVLDIGTPTPQWGHGEKQEKSK